MGAKGESRFLFFHLNALLVMQGLFIEMVGKEEHIENKSKAKVYSPQ